MKHIPDTHNALVLRTDFSDTAAWEAICAAIRKPVGAFKAYVDFVSDPAYDGISIPLRCGALKTIFRSQIWTLRNSPMPSMKMEFFAVSLMAAPECQTVGPLSQ